jgi:hypothetical protein
MRNATDITILLDRSGSMSNIWKDMTGGINAFIAEQKAVEGECAITVVLFDSIESHDVVCESRNIREMEPIEWMNYAPRGSTPLVDAMVRTIDCTGERLRRIPEQFRPDKVIFMCVTDGGENASVHFAKPQLAERIAEQTKKYNWHFTKPQLAERIAEQTKKYNWQFSFLGANFDAFGEAASFGMSALMAANYAYTPTSARNMMRSMSLKAASYRASTADSMTFSSTEQAAIAAGNVIESDSNDGSGDSTT